MKIESFSLLILMCLHVKRWREEFNNANYC